MVTKMIKYSIVLPSEGLDAFLGSLQDLGLMDVTRKQRAFDEESASLFGLAARYKTAIKLLAATDKTADPQAYGNDFDNMPPESLLSFFEECNKKLVADEKELTVLKREEIFTEAWGDFDKKDIEKISALGYDLVFYSVSNNKYEERWEEEYPVQILNRTSSKTYFAVVVPKGEVPGLKFPPAKLPDIPISEYRKKMADLEESISKAKSMIACIAGKIDRLKQGMDDAKTEIDMYLAKDSAGSEGEGAISVLEGFAPEGEDQRICGFLDNEEVLYLKEEATEEDNPPIKLKNNRFARLFEPIGDLYMLPKYGEMDLTPYFAPFYMLFFGLCLGDIGYGIILILAGLVVKMKIPSFKGYGSLIQVLGLGSIIMPLLSGTFFGMSIGEKIPSLSGLFMNSIQMFWFAIIFGVFQIVFAKMMRGISLMCTKGFIHGLAHIGWALLISAAAFGYASMEGAKVLPSQAMTWMAITGALLILFFSKTEGNIIKRILKGITSFWDITGVFGDTLSYIRLFGLGTSGGILGLVVNSVASEMAGIPYIGWLLTGLMLIIGHTAVLFLSALGAFVHPMRLTFIEFYKNAEFEGGGRAFRPFRKGGKQ